MATSTLQIHSDTLPTFEVRVRGTYSVLEMSCESDKGDTMTITVFLPQGMTKGDFIKAAQSAREKKAAQ